MIAGWQWLLLIVTRQFWFRAALFSLAGVVAAGSAILLAPYVPRALTTKIGSDAIDEILTLIASSMLAVAVFSLSTIVSAYGAATSSVTPRATKLLMDDTTSKNVVGTFVGAFLYSLVGIIALGTGLYGREGRSILLGFTIVLIVVIAVTLLRWVDYLAGFGRVTETIGLVEKAAAEAFARWREHPQLGAMPFAHDEIPDDAVPVPGPIGYVQHVDVEAIEACAKERGVLVFIVATPGAFIGPRQPLAFVASAPGVAPGVGADEQRDEAIRDAIGIGDARTFEQDPRFGLSVLAEIASRALSPAVNDPGTAIDVIGRAVRLLAAWGEAGEGDEAAAQCTHVCIAPLATADLFDDVFSPIARDGASMVEVQMRLQKALASLATLPRGGFADAASRHAALSVAHAEAAMRLEEEKQVIRTLAARVGAA
jgi:uncharacterized membrane protein